MKQNKLGKWNRLEVIVFFVLIVGIIINAIITKDSRAALISAVCGITYTVLAGKGTPYCYLFGLCGSGFYSFLSFHNALWGNLVLYACYYIPMQALGYIQWRKHLSSDLSTIKKETLPRRIRIIVLAISLIIAMLGALLLYFLNDTHPILDSVTTIVSILGMYLTVRRVLEQWISWFVVNLLSCIMWLKVLISGERVYSTVIMWAVYTFFAVYFYVTWKKDLDSHKEESL